MTIPLFGFNPNQPRVQASDFPKRENFGSHFLAAFGPAVESSADRFHQSQQNELDRAFEMRAQEERIRSERNLQDDRQRHDITVKERAGEIGPSVTPDRMEFMRLYTSDQDMQRAIGTTSDGVEYFHKPLWDAAMKAQAGELRTVPGVPREDSGATERVLGEGYRISDEVRNRAAPDERGMSSPNALAQLHYHSAHIMDLYGLKTNRMTAQRQGTADADAPTLRDWGELRSKYMLMRIVDPNGRELHGEEKASVAGFRADTELMMGIHPEVMEDPVAAAGRVLQYQYLPPLNAESIKQQDLVTLATADDQTGAVRYWQNTGMGALIEGYDEDYLEEFTGTKEFDSNNSVLPERLRQDIVLRKAFLLMARHDNAEDLENFFSEYGGYSQFRDLYDSGVIKKMQRLAPERFGDFSFEDANTITSAPPGAGNTSPIADNPANRDSIPPSPADSLGADSDKESNSPVATVGNAFEQVGRDWEANIRADPAYAGEIEEFLLAVSDPETGVEKIIQELDDITRFSYENQLFSEAEMEAHAVLQTSLSYLIQSDRENFTRTILPVLQRTYDDAMNRIRGDE